MNAFFTFKVSDLSARLTRSNQWEWHGRCKAEAGLLNHPKADLSVEPISETDLITSHIVSNFDIKQPAALELQQRLSAAQTDGSADAVILQHWAEHKGALGVIIGLRPPRYELFRTFVMLHFGRQDLIGRISFPFHGFAASPEGGLILPNEREFLAGRPYLVVDDGSIVFSANPHAWGIDDDDEAKKGGDL
jgi:hypothetical protein